ncbi:hypothetical protein L0Y47_21430 [Ectopseudomonas composti]
MARRIEYTGDPVITVAEVAAQCRVETDDLQKDLVELVIIPGITAQAEAKTGAAIRAAEYVEEWPESYGSGHALDVGQATGVVSIGRVESDGSVTDLQPLPAHRLQQGQRESFLHFPQGRPPGRLVIRYKAGADLAAYPAVKQWLMLHCGSVHEHRESVVIGTIVAKLPDGFLDYLLAEITVPPRL